MLDNAYFENMDSDPHVEQLRERLAESDHLLQLLMNVMDLAATIENPSSFINQCLELICKDSNSIVGIAWVLDRSTNRLVYRADVQLGEGILEFVEVSRQQELPPGAGLPGKIFQTGRFHTISGLRDSERLPRLHIAKRAGVKFGFGFPIKSKDGVIGVFEFFGRRNYEFDKQAEEVLMRLGWYLGMVFERKDAELNLRESQKQQKRLEEQLRATADEAIASGKLKSEFVANVSHEIRTPLAGLMGMAELLSTNPDLDQETREIADYILSSSHSLLAIVNDLLDFSKLEAGKLTLYKTYFSIKNVVEEVARSVRVTADKKGLPVLTEIDPKLPPTVLGDEGRLVQILLNFASNAVKFTEQGNVRIAAKLESISGNTARVRIAVSDTGIGISPDAKQKLFAPFVQADGSTTRKYGGTGLGLSIAKKLAKLMSAEIEMDSEPGKGSTFSVILPLELEEERLVG